MTTSQQSDQRIHFGRRRRRRIHDVRMKNSFMTAAVSVVDMASCNGVLSTKPKRQVRYRDDNATVLLWRCRRDDELVVLA